MLKTKKGEVFVISKDNPPDAGYTISECVCENPSVCFYSLAEGTEISAEIYPYYKFLIPSAGKAEVYSKDGGRLLSAGEAVFLKTDSPVGITAKTDTVYTEILIGRNSIMNKAIIPGEVFKLSELVPYAEGKIVNMDVVRNDTMKFVIMAFSEGTGLSEHAAPGEALVFALDGEGIIGYEGKEHIISAGENFSFAKGGMHYVKAKGNFKMALLLTLA